MSHTYKYHISLTSTITITTICSLMNTNIDRITGLIITFNIILIKINIIIIIILIIIIINIIMRML